MKSTKEKAIELIESFENLTDECDCLEYSCICFSMYRNKAKQCALILVDQIILILSTLRKPEYTVFLTNDLFKIIGQEYETHSHGYDLIAYFEDVKQEINNLVDW